MPSPTYNTSPPTPLTLNTIDSVVLNYGLRDFLLNKNIQPVYPFLLNQVGGPRIGEPYTDTLVNGGSNVIPSGLPLEIEGIFRKDNNLLVNQYKNNLSTANDLVDINFYPAISQPTSWGTSSYLDEYGALNLGNSGAIQASNIIGSVLNGQGLGLARSGVVTNFDIRSSLVGRVLGSTGIINDTKLGMIGGQQLALALANNAAFNVQQSVLGSLNVQDNILSLVKNGTLAGFRPNYQITVPSSVGGKILDYTSRILGFTLPKSYLEDSGSIFQSENGDVENIDRANSMLNHTGKGQLTALIKNIVANISGTGTGNDSPDKTTFRSGYAPGYEDHKGVKQINGNQIYAFGSEGHLIGLIKSSDSIIPDLSFKRENKVSESGFKDTSMNGNDPDVNHKNPFTWTSNPNSGALNSVVNYDLIIETEKKSLLVKTQKLFNSKGMLNIISVKGASNITPSQIQTAVYNNMISKGSAVLGGNNFDSFGNIISNSGGTPDNTFCRSWTTFDRYERVKNLIRHEGLKQGTNSQYVRGSILGSILDDNGFPKIAPYTNKKGGPVDPKRYMFSIENLAWNDVVATKLLECEIGPGDLISGKRGRIMWFPPYDINFTENTSVNWESNNFIGRGEPVYTYNNTERSGTLSFKLVVDHPSNINSFKDPNKLDNQFIASFFAGCAEGKDIGVKITADEASDAAKNGDNNIIPIKNVEDQPTPPDFDIYFPNNDSTISLTYENGLQNPLTTTIDYLTNSDGSGFGLRTHLGYNDNTNFGLNGKNNVISVDGQSLNGFLDPAFISSVNAFLNEKCPACSIEITGYASPQGLASDNQELAIDRAQNTINNLKLQLFSDLSVTERDKHFKPAKFGSITGGGGCSAISDVDTKECKTDRKITVRFKFDPSLLPKQLISAPPVVKSPSNVFLNKNISNRLYTECDYFEKLTEENPFVFDKFRDKIKYFHPAFHSTTPEGLNSRLTFLQQCTRQGPTFGGKDATTNLAFGRPPICILRIGDFFNTKIVIDNIGVDYEPLVWDINPEGIGVQPMIANVNITFKFIGGSTLMGPINKLQNALSFNYYANTQIYDPRADYIADNKIVNDSVLVTTEEPKLEDIKPKDTTPENDQIKDESKNGSNGNKETETPTSINDIDKIISIKYIDTKPSGDFFVGKLEIQLSEVLSKTYNFKLCLVDPIRPLHKELGLGVVGSQLMQEYFYTNTYVGLVSGSSYRYYLKLEEIGNKYGNTLWVPVFTTLQTSDGVEFGGGSFGGGGSGGYY